MKVFIEENPAKCIAFAEGYCKGLSLNGYDPRIDKRTLPIKVTYKVKVGGINAYAIKESCIMTPKVYEKWCVGRTYFIGDTLYSSGLIINYKS